MSHTTLAQQELISIGKPYKCNKVCRLILSMTTPENAYSLKEGTPTTDIGSTHTAESYSLLEGAPTTETNTISYGVDMLFC